MGTSREEVIGMPRSFHAQDVNALPALSASEAVAMATLLETRAGAHKLSPDVA
jgi:hypothetical protein